MHWACSWSSFSSSAGRFASSTGVGQTSPTVVAVFNIGGAAAGSMPSFGTRKGREVSSPVVLEQQRVGAVMNAAMFESMNKGLGLDAMTLEEEGGNSDAVQVPNRRTVLLVDVMGTIVRDPFLVDIPAFFGLTFKEFLADKHPTAWIEFEKGLLTEEEFAAKMFNDKRYFDYGGLKQCVTSGYEYLEGMEALLQRLKVAGVDMHVLSNYPCWFRPDLLSKLCAIVVNSLLITACF